jgi:hypothetical protein
VSFESEVLLGRFRAHASRLIIPTLLLGLSVFLLSFFFGWATQQWQQWLLYGGTGVLAFFGFVVPLIRYLTAWTDITTARVVVRSGLWGQHYRSVAIAGIADISRLPGGPVNIQVQDEEPLELRGLPKPRLIMQELIRLKQATTLQQNP